MQLTVTVATQHRAFSNLGLDLVLGASEESIRDLERLHLWVDVMKVKAGRVVLFTRRTAPLCLYLHQPAPDLLFVSLRLLNVILLVRFVAAAILFVPARFAQRVP